MKTIYLKMYGVCLGLLLGSLIHPGDLVANPDRYPEFAQREGSTKVEPKFIHLEQLVEEIINKKKPLIVDVRSHEEYTQSHIKASVSIPLAKIKFRLAEIPKDRLVVLY